jgi:hypothetical protein
MTEQLKRLPNDLCQFQALNPDIAATLELSGSLDRGIDYKGDGIETVVDECITMLKSDGEIDKEALINKLQELKRQIDFF